MTETDRLIREHAEVLRREYEAFSEKARVFAVELTELSRRHGVEVTGREVMLVAMPSTVRGGYVVVGAHDELRWIVDGQRGGPERG